MINTIELSKKLGIHINTIYRYIKKGMPCIQLDKGFLFDYEEVIKWLKERK